MKTNVWYPAGACAPNPATEQTINVGRKMKSQARLQKALEAREEPAQARLQKALEAKTEEEAAQAEQEAAAQGEAHEDKKTEEAAQVEQEAEAKEGEDDSQLKEAIAVFQELTIKLHWETAQKSWEQKRQANEWGTWGRREIAPGEEAV